MVFLATDNPTFRESRNRYGSETPDCWRSVRLRSPHPARNSEKNAWSTSEGETREPGLETTHALFAVRPAMARPP